MPTHGKKYTDAVKKIETDKLYAPAEAIALLREVSFTKFDPTIELHMQLGVDPRHADQMVRGTATLPAGTGKEVKVLVFAQADKAAEAQAAGADFVGLDDYIKQINEGWLGFDVAVATPDVMAKVASLGRRLGPRGLMPNPKAGTVTADVGRAVKEVKAGRVEFRVDKTSLLHIPIGKLSFSNEQIEQNLASAIDAVMRAKPTGAKGQYVKSVVICSTMSPSIRLDTQTALAMQHA
ncbi:MAG TPA: 50S ribosomal protein L1 [Ktedonobacterales bacterium]